MPWKHSGLRQPFGFSLSRDFDKLSTNPMLRFTWRFWSEAMLYFRPFIDSLVWTSHYGDDPVCIQWFLSQCTQTMLGDNLPYTTVSPLKNYNNYYSPISSGNSPLFNDFWNINRGQGDIMSAKYLNSLAWIWSGLQTFLGSSSLKKKVYPVEIYIYIYTYILYPQLSQ